MGATASLQPEVFSLAKDEYENRKDSGMSDEELFNHMKSFIESKTKELEPHTTSTIHHSQNVSPNTSWYLVMLYGTLISTPFIKII